MRPQHAALLSFLALSLLTGCAAPSWRARAALAQGRYEDAVSGFQDILALDDAITVLTRAIEQAPKSETAQLDLGLSYLQKGEDGPAEEHMKTLRGLGPHARMAAHVDRALRLMRSEQLSADMRAFIAASLADEAEWAREVRLTQYAFLRAGFYRYSSPFGPCFMTRSEGVFCY